MAYRYYKQVTVNMPSTNQVNFTVRVPVTDANLRSIAFGGHVRTDHDDVAFFADAGLTTQLAHEDKLYDEVNGRIIKFLKVPDTSVPVFMAYNNPSIVAPTENPTAAYDSHTGPVYNFKSPWVPPTRVTSTPIIDRNSDVNHVEQVYDSTCWPHSDGIHIVMLYSGMAAPANLGEQAVFRAIALVSSDLTLAASWTETGRVIVGGGAPGRRVDSTGQGYTQLSVGATRLVYVSNENTNTVEVWTTTDEGVTMVLNGTALSPADANSLTETVNSQFAVTPKAGGGYEGLYSWRDGSHILLSIRYASSPTGLAGSWTKDGGGDRLAGGGAGSLDEGGIGWHQLIRKGVIDATYDYCIYESGARLAGTPPLLQVRNYIARSSGGLTGPWTKPPTVLAGPSMIPGTFDVAQLATPAIYNPTGSEWLLFACGAQSKDQSISTWSLCVRRFGRRSPADAFAAVSYNDSAATAKHLTVTAGMLSDNVGVPGTSGEPGSGFAGDWSTAKLQAAGVAINPTRGTVSWWGRARFANDATYPTGPYQDFFEIQGSTPSRLFHCGFEDKDFYAGWVAASDERCYIPIQLSDLETHHYNLNWVNGSGSQIWQDNVSIASFVGLTVPFVTTGLTLTLGALARVPTSSPVDIDGFKVSDVDRDAAWRAAEYLNDTNPGAFLTFGAEVDNGPPASTGGTSSSAVRGSAVVQSAVQSSAVRGSALG